MALAKCYKGKVYVVLSRPLEKNMFTKISRPRSGGRVENVRKFSME